MHDRAGVALIDLNSGVSSPVNALGLDRVKTHAALEVVGFALMLIGSLAAAHKKRMPGGARGSLWIRAHRAAQLSGLVLPRRV